MARSQASPIFYLPFFAIIHRSRNREGLGAVIPWMMWDEHEVDIGEGGVQLPNLCTGSSVQVLYHVFGLQILAWWKQLILTGKKLAFKFSTWISAPPPYVHLASTHVMNASWPSRIFTDLLIPYIIMNANRSRGGLGTRLGMLWFYACTEGAQ